MLLKGLLDRILLLGFAFCYRRVNPLWDKLLAGRFVDVIVTMDAPPWFLRVVYGGSGIAPLAASGAGLLWLRPDQGAAGSD